jgi:putative restriction endonuclease
MILCPLPFLIGTSLIVIEFSKYEFVLSEVNQEQRAYNTWTVLTSHAANRKTITYGELADKLHIHHRVIRFVLGLIQEYCMVNELPPLTILVLNKHSVLPGDGFIAYDIENSQDGIEKVYSFDWSTIENPFEYAQVGTTENDLIEDLVKSPETSKDVYIKVKVRGIAQRIFRQALLRVYEYSCAICGLSLKKP